MFELSLNYFKSFIASAVFSITLKLESKDISHNEHNVMWQIVRKSEKIVL